MILVPNKDMVFVDLHPDEDINNYTPSKRGTIRKSNLQGFIEGQIIYFKISGTIKIGNNHTYVVHCNDILATEIPEV